MKTHQDNAYSVLTEFTSHVLSSLSTVYYLILISFLFYHKHYSRPVIPTGLDAQMQRLPWHLNKWDIILVRKISRQYDEWFYNSSVKRNNLFPFKFHIALGLFEFGWELLLITFPSFLHVSSQLTDRCKFLRKCQTIKDC